MSSGSKTYSLFAVDFLVRCSSPITMVPQRWWCKPSNAELSPVVSCPRLWPDPPLCPSRPNCSANCSLLSGPKRSTLRRSLATRDCIMRPVPTSASAMRVDRRPVEISGAGDPWPRTPRCRVDTFLAGVTATCNPRCAAAGHCCCGGRT